MPSVSELMQGMPESSPSENADRVLQRRYYLRDVNTNAVVEDWPGLCARVASHVAGAEPTEPLRAEWTRQFFAILYQRDFIPNSPCLMNAGKPYGEKQLAACFVLPIDDTLGPQPAHPEKFSIMESAMAAALIHKSGGGTGWSFGRIRPKGDRVRTTAGVASGPVSFLRMINNITEEIKQGGTRRGANMGILPVHHPDIREFITCKQTLDDRNQAVFDSMKQTVAAAGVDEATKTFLLQSLEYSLWNTQITNFNISVAITDKFMEALETGGTFDLVNPRTGQITGQEDARSIFELMCRNAWANGDPGVFFIDRTNAKNKCPHIYQYEATNPCGEQNLAPFDSCTLGSINLSRFAGKQRGGLAPSAVEGEAGQEVEWERLRGAVQTAVRFLDDVLDANQYPLPQIEDFSRKNRKIGLGVMGWADLLAQLRIRYDSDAAMQLADRVMGFIHRTAVETSSALAEEKGVFPFWPGSVWEKEGRKMRNSTVVTIAPTGTISMIADCSSGIEPFFALSWTKHVMDKDRLVYRNELLDRALIEAGYSDEARTRICDRLASGESLQALTDLPQWLRDTFRTTMDIPTEWHIRHQAAFQAHVDNAVSKTINMPNSATVQDVREAYLLAYKLGCKGVTIYRDRSRSEQVLNVGDTTAARDAAPVSGVEVKGETTSTEANTDTSHLTPDTAPPAGRKPRPRPRVTVGTTERIRTGFGKLYVTINEDEHGPCEVFCAIGKPGGEMRAMAEAIGRLISMALRAGVQPQAIIKHLRGIRGSEPTWDEGRLVLSCPDAIGISLENYLREKGLLTENGNGHAQAADEDETEAVVRMPVPMDLLEKPLGCPDCGGSVEYADNCLVCRYCGYSKCY